MWFSPSPDKQHGNSDCLAHIPASRCPAETRRIPRSRNLAHAYFSSRISKICARPRSILVIQTKK